MNYYISDLHLFHKNVTDEGSNFENRPFKALDEMHRVLKENWNSTVTNGDHVYILGDLSWKENDDTIQLVSTLRGNKHLILGNHDTVNDQRYRQLFVEITNYKEIKDGDYRVVLSHYPLAFWNHQSHYRRDGEAQKVWSVHLYGHLHDSADEQYYREFIQRLNQNGICCIAKNVGCMLNYMNYTPRTLKELLS